MTLRLFLALTSALVILAALAACGDDDAPTSASPGDSTTALTGTPGDSGGSSGNVITMPDGPDAVSIYTSLALDENGNPVVSYYDVDNGDLKMLHCGDATCGSDNVVVSPDTAGDVGSYTSLALDENGNPVVSYYDVGNLDLRVLHCGDPNCNEGNAITSPDTVGDVGSFTSLVLDDSGNPVVSYWDETNADLKVLHCGDPNCSTGSGNVITSPDSEGRVGLFSSLALDGSGNPVVSYLDRTNVDLKVLHCGDPNCSSGNVVTSPDTAGSVGTDTSLALDSSGNPVVSYYDRDNGDLKVLHCGDPNCSSGNAITSPDTAGNVGVFTSLALDGSGSPVVSYYDDLNIDLKILHCGDPSCVSSNTITSPDASPFVVGPYNSLVLDGDGNPVVSYTGVGVLNVLHCGDVSCSAPPTDAD